MVRRRGNPFAGTLKRLPHKALLRRDEPLLPSDNDEVMAVMVSTSRPRLWRCLQLVSGLQWASVSDWTASARRAHVFNWGASGRLCLS
jgi:hypothetical protein